MFVLFFINIRTREVHLGGITDSPTRIWMINKAKQMDEVLENAKGKKPLIRDGGDVRQLFQYRSADEVRQE